MLRQWLGNRCMRYTYYTCNGGVTNGCRENRGEKKIKSDIYLRLFQLKMPFTYITIVKKIVKISLLKLNNRASALLISRACASKYNSAF